MREAIFFCHCKVLRSRVDLEMLDDLSQFYNELKKKKATKSVIESPRRLSMVFSKLLCQKE